MDREAEEFLHQLLMTPSPTGDEHRIQRLLNDRLAPFADRVDVDVHGNLYLTMNPESERTVMLSAHCDQIGFIITEIGTNGFLYFEPLGGLDGGVVQGGRVTIHTRNGPIEGIFGRKAIHLQTPQEQSQAPLTKDIWIDIGAKDKADAERSVAPGDYATYALGVTRLQNGRIASPGLDDKAGLFVMAESFRRLHEGGLEVGLIAVSTVQEEVGLRGASTAAFSVRPEVTIAIDVVNASDDPGVRKGMAPCALGKGPTIPSGPSTNPVVGRMLVECARRREIPYQPAPSGSLAGNDSKALQVDGGPAAAVGIGIPNRNMHTQVEVCQLDDLENSVRLIVEFVRSINGDTDFRPYTVADAGSRSERRRSRIEVEQTAGSHVG
jgi:tetrahedral aminopeptidase